MSQYGYSKTYNDLVSPTDLTVAIREHAYRDDFGQHSWITSTEMDLVIEKLSLSKESKVLDIGCGVGGPTMFIANKVGCQIIGVDMEPNGIEAANKSVHRNELKEIVSFKQLDVSQELPFSDQQFSAVVSIDVIIHIQNRDVLFSEIARILQPRGVFAFTDAGVVTGTVTDEEFAARSINVLTLFHSPSYNETILRKAGFEIIDIKDTTDNLIQIAGGRKEARLKFKDELEKLESAETFAREQLYLETILKLATEKRLSRFTYFARKN